MFLERRPTNGIWYYKKVTMVEGKRKVLRKSLGTHCKKEAQLKAMQIYFSIESDASIESINARKAGTVLDDGFVVTNEQQTKPVCTVVPESIPEIQTVTIEQPEAVEVQKEPESGVLFADVVEAYIKENAHLWGIKETQAHRSIFNRFVNHANITTVEQCSKAFAVGFKHHLINADLSNVTINKFIGKLSNLFDYINAHYEHPNVFDGLKVKRAKQETVRSAYSKPEVQQLRAFAEKQEDYRKHMILLGLFTGARANELAQLYTSDIIEIDGIWSILIRATKPEQKLKTRNAERVIPVHSVLIKARFIEFVKSRGDGCRLFPEFKYSEFDGCSKSYSQWFNTTRPVSGKNLHEIRHTFSTALRSADVSLNVAAQLLGHQTGAISWDRYGSTAQVDIRKLKAAVEMVNYE